LFGSSFSGFGGLEGDTPFTVNTNPALQPEDSRNFTAGIVYSPRFVPGLTLSFDIWNIESSGVVFLPSDVDVLRRDERGTLLSGETVLHDPTSGEVTRIIKTYQNRGTQRARGVDLGLQYQVQTSYGTFTSLTQATYLDSFRLAPAAGAPAVEVSNAGIGASADAYLKWKGISRLDWTWKGLDVVATVRYTDGFHEITFHDSFFPDGKKEHWVKQTWFFDAQATYDFKFAPPVEALPVSGYSKSSAERIRGNEGRTVVGWKNRLNNTSITIGCNNVFGQDPPKAYGEGFGNPFGYPAAIYDPTGRFLYVTLRKKF